MFRLTDLLKVIDPDPVLIDHQACLRARHKRSACRACTAVCPDGAMVFEEGKIQVDPGKCSRCGLCIGACPTAALTLRGTDEDALLASAHASCSEARVEGTQVPCLGMLTPDHMVAMGLRSEAATLTSGNCASCKWSTGGDIAARNVVIANDTLQALGSAHRIRLTTAAAAAAASQDRVVSRRQLLALWGVESKQIAKGVLPERDVNPLKLSAKVPSRRTAWLKQISPQAVDETAAMPAGPWKARVVTEACMGCGICAAFCPTGAFVQRKENDEWFLSHQAAACVACGTCVALCPVKAVGEEPAAARDLVAGVTRDLAQRQKIRCASCRKEFMGRPGETTCVPCRSVTGMLRI